MFFYENKFPVHRFPLHEMFTTVTCAFSWFKDGISPFNQDAKIKNNLINWYICQTYVNNSCLQRICSVSRGFVCKSRKISSDPRIRILVVFFRATLSYLVASFHRCILLQRDSPVRTCFHFMIILCKRERERER